MVRALFLTSALLLSLLVYMPAHAQIDPSSGLLLGPGISQDGPSLDSGVESGRYTTTKRKSQAASRRKASAPADDGAATVETKVTTTQTTTVKTQTPILVDMPEAPKATPTPIPVLIGTPTPTPPLMPVPVPVPVPTATPAVLTLPAISPAAIDRRWDLLNVDVAPSYLIQDAKSRYTYRNEQFTAPGVTVRADAWLLPTFGFHASFFSSLSGSVSDSLNGSQDVWATQQNIAIGARWRRAMSASTLAPTLTFGADWEDDQLKTPSASMLRQHLTTSGLNLSGGLEIPSSANYAWTSEVSIMPLASQTERSNAVEISSGHHTDTNALGLSFGGRYAFDHASSVYWKLTGRLQKDVYDGQASPPDPISGQTLSGVTITTKSLLLEIGFSFGN